MRRIALCSAASICALSTHAGVVLVPGWGAPVFREEFNGDQINPSTWEVAFRANEHNGEAQFYHPDQVSVWDGALHLRADRDPTWAFGKEYRSGLVRTWQEWSYGRFEVRAKVPWGQGFWPAIWLLPRNASWPAGGEIDIMEARGDLPYRMSSALHWGWDTNNHQYRSQAYESGANFTADYHDYAVEWEVGTVRFYVDGVQHMVLYEPDVGIPSTPKSLILNLAVGGNYSGYPDGSTPFPAGFDIDYARVWQRPEFVAPPDSALIDPGFEDDGGTLLAWQRFGNTIDNVTSDWGTHLDGERSLKLFGQFDHSTDNISGAYQNLSIQGGGRIIVDAAALTRSEDSVVGTQNKALLKVEFYSEPGGAYESAAFLGEQIVTLGDGAMAEDTWISHELQALAPLDAAEARITLVYLQQVAEEAGAIFIDSVAARTYQPGDFDGDGDVDDADYGIAFANFTGPVGAAGGQTGADGEIDGDGDIDDADFGIAFAHFTGRAPRSISPNPLR